MIGKASLLAATMATAVAAQDVVRVGSKTFTESVVLAELMAQTIEQHTELVVERRQRLGGTLICWQAVKIGEIDLYADYTGTGWATVLGRDDTVNDPLRAYLEVDRVCREQHDVRWLPPFGFQNTYALAMRREQADALGITRISDLLAHQQELRGGFGPEFFSRNDGLPGLAAAYGLRLANVRTIEHGLAYEAVQSGAIDVIDAYSTDGKLLRFGLRVLDDDRAFFPPYHAAPVVRGATLRAHPELGAALERLAFRVDERDAQELNLIVEADGMTARAVARAFLELEGIVDGRDGEAAAARKRLEVLRGSRGAEARPSIDDFARPGLLELIGSRGHDVLGRLLEHLLLTLVSVLLATVTAVPLGILMAARPRLQRLALGVTSVVQTVPSLALLAFMIPLLGLGVSAAVAALFLYALLPILRNTCTGITGVSPRLIDVAVGMGMRPRDVLRRVQLPLALPMIMAGVRTSTVIGIGVATLAAFIGAGGLGQLIYEGIQLNDHGLILLGAVPAAALAVLADFVLGRVERVLSPVV